MNRHTLKQIIDLFNQTYASASVTNDLGKISTAAEKFVNFFVQYDDVAIHQTAIVVSEIPELYRSFCTALNNLCKIMYTGFPEQFRKLNEEIHTLSKPHIMLDELVKQAQIASDNCLKAEQAFLKAKADADDARHRLAEYKKKLDEEDRRKKTEERAAIQAKLDAIEAEKAKLQAQLKAIQ